MVTVPAHAGAAASADPCEIWTADISAIMATGPGTVSVVGRVTTPRKSEETGPCSYDAQLAGYVVERVNQRYWRLAGVTGRAQLASTWQNGDEFRQSLSIAVGTGAVCVRTADAAGLTCDEVTVAAEKDGSPALPVVGRELYPGASQGGDVCGNCVTPPVDP